MPERIRSPTSRTAAAMSARVRRARASGKEMVLRIPIAYLEHLHALNPAVEPMPGPRPTTRETPLPPIGFTKVATAPSDALASFEGARMLKSSDSRTESFTKLFAESRRALHRYIRRFVHSGETAKEIAQEAFLR